MTLEKYLIRLEEVWKCLETTFDKTNLDLFIKNVAEQFRETKPAEGETDLQCNIRQLRVAEEYFAHCLELHWKKQNTKQEKLLDANNQE